ncbi:hypothetical protein H5410_041894 [Solanum commersonii]|uniref:Legumain prodomain domain-containing protein n=1 Tax=Solanum commersonii TaxID=4109 RepID=A0A9J5XVX4_SOLCO|nr:hypothetical protein H5410_041894 [Solanum commersonii]
MEACDSGSMFDGLLNEGLNIYVTIASKPVEDSWATCCSFSGEPCLGECPPKGFNNTCLGDLFSVSWLENRYIRKRVLNNATHGSHVMQYGDLHINKDSLSKYMGFNSLTHTSSTNNYPTNSRHANQRDVQLLYLLSKFHDAPEGEHVDKSVKHIGQILFGVKNGPEVLNIVRPAGQPLVDDWDCLKSFIFESHCGSLTRYGRKHVRGFANMCNAGIQRDQMDAPAKQTCSS